MVQIAAPGLVLVAGQVVVQIAAPGLVLVAGQVAEAVRQVEVPGQVVVQMVGRDPALEVAQLVSLAD